MNLLELVDKRDLKFKELENLLSNIKNEKRKLDETEDISFQSIKNELSVLDNEIIAIQEADKNLGKRSINASKKINEIKMENQERFSLLKAINTRSNGGQLDEISLNVIEQGKQEMRKSGLSFSGDIVLPMNYRANITARSPTS